MSPQPDDKNTPTRPIRVDPDLWEPFGEVAKPDRSTVLREFMRWYIHAPGAKQPKRPSEPAPDPATGLPTVVRVSRDGTTYTNPQGRSRYDLMAIGRQDEVMQALAAAGIKGGYSTQGDVVDGAAATRIVVLGAANVMRRIYDALMDAGVELAEVGQ